MGWFTPKPKIPEESEQAHDVRVEVVVANEANKKIAQKAKDATNNLNELLEANHFTIKIYRAAGGKTSSTNKKAKG